MTHYAFDGAFASPVRPARKTSGAQPWAKDATTPEANDGTRLTATLLNDLVAAVRHVIATANSGATPGDDTAITVAVQALVASGIAAAVAPLAPRNNPALTGTPTAPTAAPGTSTDQIATTAFVQAMKNALVGGAPGALDTLTELAAALANDASYATTITNALALKAPLASPSFTGAMTVTGNVHLGDSQRGLFMDPAGSYTYGIGKSAAGASARLDFYANGARGTIASNGYFGIGTQSPLSGLHVNNAASGAATPLASAVDRGLLISDLSSTNAAMQLGINGGNAAYIQARSSTGSGASALNMTLNPLGGNVGIGTTAPATKLHVEDASAPTIRVKKTSGTGADITTDGTSLVLTNYDAGDVVLNGSQSGAGVSFYGGGAQRGRLTASGLDNFTDTYRQRTARTPASASAAGNQGDIAWDASYVYVCIATNTWRRIPRNMVTLMAYTETFDGGFITLDVGPDWRLRAGNVEKRFKASMDSEPRPDVIRRDVLTVEMLQEMLPDQAALLLQAQQQASQIATLTTEVATMTAARDAAEARVAALEAQIAAANAESTSSASTISNYQARVALKAAGLFEAIDAAAKLAGETSQFYMAWEYAPSWRRDAEFLVQLAQQFALTEQQVDDLFAAAAAV